nr:hypothetical protein TetV2_00063 [Oceanusvirus sp.]
MLLLYRLVAAAIIFGTWPVCFQIAKTTMSDTFQYSLIMLRTKSRVADTRLLRIFGSLAGYAMVINLIAVAIMAGGILLKDMEDRFGFATFAVSWEYMVHPNYFMMLILMMLVTFVAMVISYQAEKTKDNITLDTYNKVTNVGMIAWMATGTVLLFLMMMYTHKKEVLDLTMIMQPSGRAQGEYIALSLLTSTAPDINIQDAKLGYMQDYRKEAADLARDKIPQDEVTKLEKFVTNVRGKGFRFQKGDKTKNEIRKLAWSMRENMFDEPTRKAAVTRMTLLQKDHAKRMKDWMKKSTT